MPLEDPEVAILRLGFVEKVQVLMSMKVKIIQDYIFNHLNFFLNQELDLLIILDGWLLEKLWQMKVKVKDLR